MTRSKLDPSRTRTTRNRFLSSRYAPTPAAVALALLVAVYGCSGSGGGGGGSSATQPAAGSDTLPVPDPKDGFQMTITGYEVPANGENEVCEKFILTNDAPLEIGGYQINMPVGSHHFVVYAYDGDQPELYPDGVYKSTGCMTGGPPDRMALTQIAGAGSSRDQAQYPPGTGIVLQPHQTILLNSHYANSTDEVLHPTVYVNLLYAKQKIVHPLEALVISNYSINIPPESRRRATARWTVPIDLKLVMLASHEHKRGDSFAIRIAQGSIDRPGGDKIGTNFNDDSQPFGSQPAPGDFYRSENWQHPTVLSYDDARLVPKGTVLEFDCTQHNEKPVPLTFGPLSDDEMCIITGYFYRAETAPPQGTLIPGCLPASMQLSCPATQIANVDPGGAPIPTPVPVEIGGALADIESQIFMPSCALPSCHSSQTQAGALILEPASVYNELVNVSPLSTGARQAGLLRVKPGDPDNSFLIRKLEGTLDPGEGDPMPLTGPKLSDDQIGKIRAWIADGAPPR